MTINTMRVTKGGLELFDKMMIEFPEIQVQIERGREYNRLCSLKWRKENPERAKQLSKRYYLENRDKIYNCQKKYREKNKERILELGRQYYYENREANMVRHREYYRKNKEKICRKLRELYHLRKLKLMEKENDK